MKSTVIIGAGPAGLAAGYKLSKAGKPLTLIERQGTVGGLSQSFRHKGFTFDIGPHLFKNRNEEVVQLWDFLSNKKYAEGEYFPPIFYYDKNFYTSLVQTIAQLPKGEVAGLIASMITKKMLPRNHVASGEDWIKNTRGTKMYNKFYKDREEKFWGTPLNLIDKEWYVKRCENKPLTTLFAMAKKKKSLSAPKKLSNHKRTFVDRHPEHGAGKLFEKLKEVILADRKNKLLLNTELVKVHHAGDRILGITVRNKNTKRETTVSGENFISTAPVNEIIRKLSPQAPRKLLDLSKKLFHRDVITVNVIAKPSKEFSHSYINVYSSDVRVFRITNFRNLSKKMGNKAEPDNAPICLEYNCFKNDELWRLSDEELLALAKKELAHMGLVEKGNVFDGFVKRIEQAYPVHVIGIKHIVAQLHLHLAQFKNLQVIGRNGVFSYNQMGHSVESGFKAAENILGNAHNLTHLSLIDHDSDVI